MIWSPSPPPRLPRVSFHFLYYQSGFPVAAAAALCLTWRLSGQSGHIKTQPGTSSNAKLAVYKIRVHSLDFEPSTVRRFPLPHFRKCSYFHAGLNGPCKLKTCLFLQHRDVDISCRSVLVACQHSRHSSAWIARKPSAKLSNKQSNYRYGLCFQSKMTGAQRKTEQMGHLFKSVMSWFSHLHVINVMGAGGILHYSSFKIIMYKSINKMKL